ncbi:hypothetical protein FA95DRAFT_1600760 [Auriscalpium vulgare]|uniref:Uncharacterized protein n=1 Tax=Auriscalpium vulgare TaxID=40419 RepID=A0ACB8SB12_9AGAM|nr:hypothetical protein FA95DRAFT_1600760 [Auriscalpium vulgare]
MSLFELFLTAVYIAALLIWEFVHTNNLDPSFWSNKAVHIAAAQLPLLPALSSKNNVIGWLTGIGHEKLNVLHRIVARCILVLIWVHLWGRWKIGFTGVDDIASHGWIQLGVVAGITYTLAIVLSIRPIRAYWYEVFHVLHVVLIFVFILTAYLHASEPGFGTYVWPTWVVWGFDRVFRLSRHIALNVVLKPQHTEGTLSLVTPDSLRLHVTRRLPLGWRPGQHVFLTFPTIATMPFETHPFTIASIPSATEGSEKQLTFYIRGRKGLTQKLVEQATDKDGVKVPVSVEGPYGAPPNLAPYATSILVAGGTGVSYTLPLLLDLVKQSRDGTALTKRIVFIWILRNEDHLEWIASALADAQACAPPSLTLDINVFVTSKRDATPTVPVSPHKADGSESPSREEDSKKSPEAAELGGLTPLYGRPDMRDLLQGVLRDAEGPVSIDVSGPAGLVKDVRGTLASLVTSVKDVLKGGPTIHFHAETFTL